MAIRRVSAALVLALAVLVEAGSRPLAARQGGEAQPVAPQPPQQTDSQQQAGRQQPDPQVPTPTFRGGINFVSVDVIVTDGRGQPVTDLTAADFEVLEDGKPQKIEQFRLVRVDGNPRPGERPRQIRTRVDEELEAAREDVRVFVFLLDDYHVRLGSSMSVREPLTRFISTHLRPNDLIGVMYPLTPVSALSLTRDHDAVIRAIRQFEGRKFDYRPRNQFEETYSRYPTEVVERIRNDVVLTALEGLSVRLGSLRDGRKSIIWVSEGLTAMLPPQLRARDAERGNDPLTAAALSTLQDSDAQIMAEWFGQADLYRRIQELTTVANRNNTAIYALDPRGLMPFEFGVDMPAVPSFAADNRAMRLTQDTLRVVAEETDGRAIINSNNLDRGLAEMVRDASVYYLLGYTSSVGVNDGKFHEITVRVKRRGVDVRARKGYWAMTAADVERATNPKPDVARPVQQALASIATSVQAGKYVRTWIGTERGPGGRTRVTLVWEPLPQNQRQGAGHQELPAVGRVSLLAANADGDLVFRGRSPEAALASAAPPAAAEAGAARAAVSGAPPAAVPQRVVFDAPPGKLELRMTVEAAGTGGTLDTEIRTIDVPDLTAPPAGLSTPRVFRARTAREMQAILADPGAVPVASREFSRAERLVIRFDVYGSGAEPPAAAAALLNRGGQKMADLPVAQATAGGTHQIDFSLGAIPPGEYLVEITVKGPGGEAKELVPFRVGS
jgi:VWFA-related protein